jgi:hypothetical protein
MHILRISTTIASGICGILWWGDIIPRDAGLSEETARKFAPNYPKQLTSQFALGAAKTIDKIAEDAIELLLPRNYKDIANERTSTKGKGDMIQ